MRGTPSLEKLTCCHCGALCGGMEFVSNGKPFCCQGCLAVYELLTENGLHEFYQLNESAGVRVNGTAWEERYRFLDEPSVRERLVDFSDERLTRVTFRLPAIHCIACVWLLENLFRLNPAIGASQVNFPRKEVALTFDPARAKLSQVAALLASLGYEPELKLSNLDARPRQYIPRRLWVQVGLAGFAFGNIMLFSIAGYFGLDAFSGPGFRRMTGWISFLLALPVVIHSASDYWRMAWTSLRQRLLNIDVPIAAGIAALFVQSSYEVLAQGGNGYFDSLTGLIFFLLCGRLFQQKTYDRLAFDLDYKSFFPLSATRRQSDGEHQVSLAQLQVGDRLNIRHGELVPADARLVGGQALVDYSFVTGESEPVERHPGDLLYAGGRQLGGAIEVETVKAVSQSYLTSLWNQEAFRKDRSATLNTLTNKYSRWFTKIVIAIALGSAAFWAVVNPALSMKAFTSVLIVACPCALALAAPFALGSAQRVLARGNVFLKNPYILETLARVDAVVFDKTGTLTGASSVKWRGDKLNDSEEQWICSLTRNTTHPLGAKIANEFPSDRTALPVRSYRETTGCGMEGSVEGHQILMGSATWLKSRQIEVPGVNDPALTTVHVAVDGRHRGLFTLAGNVRPDTDKLTRELSQQYELALLTGDNAKERETFTSIFGPKAHLHFNQSPLNKLDFVKELQRSGRTVLMAGDGLNDAGALKQSDVGVAVVESVGAFSPASDVILAANRVTQLGRMLRYARRSVRVVQASFLISAIYNVVGITIAARGLLSPVVCAILMPLSSISVVAFACGMTAWLGRRLHNGEARP